MEESPERLIDDRAYNSDEHDEVLRERHGVDSYLAASVLSQEARHAGWQSAPRRRQAMEGGTVLHQA